MDEQIESGDYFGYIRVSSLREKKKNQAISPETQEGAIVAFAGNHGLRITEIISDLNVSGGREKFLKRKIMPLIDRVRAGEAKGVVVYNLSRWGRSQLESMLSEADLKEAGGRLLSCTEPNDVKTPAGRLGRTTLHAVSEFQRGVITDSWMAAHRHRISRGLPKDGRPRFGYLYVRDERGARYELDPERSERLAQAYRRALAGESLWAIAVNFRSLGVTAIGQDGTPKLITYMGLTRALKSGFGAGLIVKDTLKTPSWLPGAHEAVITQEEWDLYRKKFVDTKRGKGRSPLAIPLRGLVRCGSCHYPMQVYQQGDVVKLACKTRSTLITTNSAGRSCPSPCGVQLHIVEQAVRDWLRLHAREGEEEVGDALVARKMKALDLRADVNVLEERLASVRAYKLNLARQEARGTITAEEHDSLRAEAEEDESRLATDINAANRDIKTHLIPPADAFGAVLQRWEEGVLDAGMLNEALSRVIKGVYVGKGRSASSPDKFDIIATWEDREPKVFTGAVRGVDHAEGKYCSCCLKFKPADDFYRRKSGRDGGALSSWCRECQRAYLRGKYRSSAPRRET